MTTPYLRALAAAAAQLPRQGDPDSVAVRQAAALAAHAGFATVDSDASWDLFTAAITAAIVDLQADLPEQVILADAPAIDPAEPGLRQAVSAVTRQLAQLCATAALAGRGSPWRRLVWARVARLLDDAATELRWPMPH